MTLRFGPFELDVARRTLTQDSLEIPLQPKVFDALRYLVENAGRVLPKEELLDALWPETFVTDNVVSRSIRQVRKVLGDDAHSPAFVRTVPRVGYEFIGTVEAGPADSTAPSPRSIAVLPFQPLTHEGRDESLELGMAEALINLLSASPDLLVRPLSAVRHYAGLDQDSQAAGLELQVEAVVEGCLHGDGEDLQITARLLRSDNGRTLWADRYREPKKGIFAVQEALARGILNAVAARPSPDKPTAGTRDSEAYRSYLLGRLRLAEVGPEPGREAIGHFERALERDPEYALAHVGLADAYSALGILGSETAECYENARRAAQRALALDPELALAYCQLGRIAWQYDWDWSATDRFFMEALKRGPRIAEIYNEYSEFLAFQGLYSKAASASRRAMELDPVSPMHGAMLAQALYMGGHYEEAILEARRSLEVAPGFGLGHLFVGLSYLATDRPEAAVAELETAVSGGRKDFLGVLGLTYAAAGMPDKARGVLDNLEAMAREVPVPPIALAMVHLGLGEIDKTFEYLERCFAERSWHVLVFKRGPLFARLRRDPRARPLLERLDESSRAPATESNAREPADPEPEEGTRTPGAGRDPGKEPPS